MSEAISGNGIQAFRSSPDFAALIRATKKEREAERRETRSHEPRPSGRDAPSEHPRPAEMHGGGSPLGVPPRLSPRGLTSPKARLEPGFLGREMSRALPGVSVPVQRAPRMPVGMPADMMPKPPGSEADNPARGHRTHPRPSQRHPAGVPLGRDGAIGNRNRDECQASSSHKKRLSPSALGGPSC